MYFQMLALSLFDMDIDVLYYSCSEHGLGERQTKLCYWIQPLLRLYNKKDQYLRRFLSVLVVCIYKFFINSKLII